MVGHLCSVVAVVNKESLLNVTLVAAVGFEEMASREMLEDFIKRLTKQLKLANATLKSTNGTLEKEHKRVVHQLGRLKGKGVHANQ